MEYSTFSAPSTVSTTVSSSGEADGASSTLFSPSPCSGPCGTTDSVSTYTTASWNETSTDWYYYSTNTWSTPWTETDIPSTVVPSAPAVPTTKYPSPESFIAISTTTTFRTWSSHPLPSSTKYTLTSSENISVAQTTRPPTHSVSSLDVALVDTFRTHVSSSDDPGKDTTLGLIKPSSNSDSKPSGTLRNSATPILSDSSATPIPSDVTTVNVDGMQIASVWRNRALVVAVIAGLEGLMLLVVLGVCVRRRWSKNDTILRCELGLSGKNNRPAPYAQISGVEERGAVSEVDSHADRTYATRRSLSKVKYGPASHLNSANPFSDPHDPSSSEPRVVFAESSEASHLASSSRLSFITTPPTSTHDHLFQYTGSQDAASSQHSALLPITFRHTPPSSDMTEQSRLSLSTYDSSREAYSRDPFGVEYNPVDANRPFWHSANSRRSVSVDDALYPSGPEESECSLSISPRTDRDRVSSSSTVSAQKTSGTMAENG